MDFQIFGGGGPVTSFSDNFTRADTTAGLGNNWLGLSNDLFAASPGHYNAPRILSNRARFTLGGAGGGTPTGAAYCPVPAVSGIYGKSQFCQFVIPNVAITVAAILCGGMVACQGDAYAGTQLAYAAFYSNSQTSMNVDVMGGQDMRTEQYLLSGGITVALGDTIRMSCIFGSASNLVTVSRNGAQVAQVTDNNAARPGIAGFPAMYIALANAGGSLCEYSSFSCGLGS